MRGCFCSRNPTHSEYGRNFAPQIQKNIHFASKIQVKTKRKMSPTQFLAVSVVSSAEIWDFLVQSLNQPFFSPKRLGALF